jgi:hypothetical protein
VPLSFQSPTRQKFVAENLQNGSPFVSTAFFDTDVNFEIRVLDVPDADAADRSSEERDDLTTLLRLHVLAVARVPAHTLP